MGRDRSSTHGTLRRRLVLAVGVWLGLQGLNLVVRREARLVLEDTKARWQVSERSYEAVVAIDRDVSATMARVASLSDRIDHVKRRSAGGLSPADSGELERLIAERTATVGRYEALQVARHRALEVYGSTSLRLEDGGVRDMVRLWAAYRWRRLTGADA